jgi:predicted nucleotidyltransferase
MTKLRPACAVAPGFRVDRPNLDAPSLTAGAGSSRDATADDDRSSVSSVTTCQATGSLLNVSARRRTQGPPIGSNGAATLRGRRGGAVDVGDAAGAFEQCDRLAASASPLWGLSGKADLEADTVGEHDGAPCGTLLDVVNEGLPVDDILRIARENGATTVRVFGSRARGDASAASDLDLLIRLEPNRSLLDLVGMKLALEDFLGVRVDVVTEQALSPYIRAAVLAEAKELVARAA